MDFSSLHSYEFEFNMMFSPFVYMNMSNNNPLCNIISNIT